MIDLYLNDNVVTLLFQSMKPEDMKDQELIEEARYQISPIYSFMEHELGDQLFAEGNAFTMADCAAAPALLYAELLAPFAEHKNISAYWERLKKRASVQKTHTDAKPIIEEFMKKNAA